MWRDILSLVVYLSLGAITLSASLGALGALMSGGWRATLVLLLIAGITGWMLFRRLSDRRARRF